jgi:hypothetical protein
MLIILIFLEIVTETRKIRDKYQEKLGEMWERVLLEMVITYKKMTKIFFNIFSRQTSTNLSCLVWKSNTEFHNGVKGKEKNWRKAKGKKVFPTQVKK